MTKARFLAHAAIFAALYAALTHVQNILLPGSATWAIQLRLSELLCVFSFFSPAAPVGLALGCLIFDLSFSAALPLDFLAGPGATFLACVAMRLLRKEPFYGLLMPALFNGLLIGAELTVYIGGGFVINAVYVALGEAIVLLFPGSILYAAIIKRQLDRRLFDRPA